jgi:micrococcal nuclease
VSRLALLLVAALVLTVAWLAPWKGGLPAVVEGTVVRAVDGDTLIVDVTGHGIERVRVIGVDTPEDVAPGRPVQCWSLRAAAFTARVATGRRVTLVLGRQRRDPYGRLLAYVSVRGMRDDLESALLRRGDARTLAIPPNTERAVRYARLQAAATARGAGLWGAC